MQTNMNTAAAAGKMLETENQDGARWALLGQFMPNYYFYSVRIVF
jgi:hypothetical protein